MFDFLHLIDQNHLKVRNLGKVTVTTLNSNNKQVMFNKLIY